MIESGGKVRYSQPYPQTISDSLQIVQQDFLIFYNYERI